MEMVVSLSFTFYGNLISVCVCIMLKGFLLYYTYPELQAYGPEIMRESNVIL